SFPPEEKYSLTDQIRRSSRSVPSNLREGFAKRRYKNVFGRHITDAWGSAEETRGWLDFALACGYLSKKTHDEIDDKYDRVCAMLYKLLGHWT
ncbi:MAG: four helix bundle protein, partial [Phycisphaerae bacterium]|nr:four helix bundle protein [Phycisphaerae bacterium]